MTGLEFKEWRQRVGLTQAEVGTRLGVTRVTIQNWENEACHLSPMVEVSCEIWEKRLRQIQPDLGPVTLVYSDGPMFVNPYGPRRPLAIMRQEPYPTNAAALARVCELWGQEDFHNPFIITGDRGDLWNVVELERAVNGSDPDAPRWRKVVVERAARETRIADENLKSLMNACARAYRAKELPKNVSIFRDMDLVEDYVFYFSPSAFALTSEIREIADHVDFCPEPTNQHNLKKISL